LARSARERALHVEIEADLARAALRRGDWALAVTEARRARKVIEQLPEATPSRIAAVDGLIARGLLELGRVDDARQRATRAIEVLEEDPAAEADALGEPLSVLGEAWLAEGDPQRAVGPLERALPLLEHAEPLAAARARFALARALVATGDASDRARDLATEARAELRDLGGHEAQLRAAIDAWLETQ
jgi:tetratricopeptide (TPR) repeat protein